ncbi:unnamed protein product, partial [Adineta ricciae]
ALSPSAYLVCLGFGLQNGMCTTYSGAVIRTTHVTGTMTDIGLILGQAVFHKRTRKNLWKLKILVPLYLSFLFGAIVGWFAHEWLHDKAILIPCAIVGCLGLGHITYCRMISNLPIEKIQKKNEELYSSAKFSAAVSDVVVKTSSISDIQSNEVDDDDDLIGQNTTISLITHNDSAQVKQQDQPMFFV